MRQQIIFRIVRINGYPDLLCETSNPWGLINPIHILEEKGIEVIYDRDKLLEEEVVQPAAVGVPAK